MTPALEWAFRLPVTGAAKTVLVALAAHADAEGRARVQQGDLSLYTGVSDRTVRRAMDSLEALGALTVSLANGRNYVLAVGFVLPADGWDDYLKKADMVSGFGRKADMVSGFTASARKSHASGAATTLKPDTTSGSYAPKANMVSGSSEKADMVSGFGANCSSPLSSPSPPLSLPPTPPLTIPFTSPSITPSRPPSRVSEKSPVVVGLFPLASDPPGAKRTKARTMVKPDWWPDAQGIAFAEKRGVDPTQEVPRFRDHHAAHGKLMADWGAAWRTWCDNQVRFRERDQRPANRRVNGLDARAAGMAAILGITPRQTPHLAPDDALTIDLNPTEWRSAQ